jgi:hypothetical protein
MRKVAIVPQLAYFAGFHAAPEVKSRFRDSQHAPISGSRRQ